MLKLHLPKELITSIDILKEGLSRPVYIIKCLQYIVKTNISIQEIEEELKSSRIRGDNDRVSETLEERENRDIS